MRDVNFLTIPHHHLIITKEGQWVVERTKVRSEVVCGSRIQKPRTLTSRASRTVTGCAKHGYEGIWLIWLAKGGSASVPMVEATMKWLGLVVRIPPMVTNIYSVPKSYGIFDKRLLAYC